LKLQDTNDSKTLLESIENFKFSDNVNFEKTDNDFLTPNKLVPKATLKYELTQRRFKRGVKKASSEFCE